ncbi:hypothetical protein [Streptomyces olivaceiscleroticus]|uniref:Transferase n=1 Tax=Streptomyces olivaceiscleroticus TaxID=68245 RepID=A0ABN1APX1_9ACTN
MRPDALERALAAAGLPTLWAARHPVLRDPEVLARAAAHVAGSLRVQPRPYRIAVLLALRLMPLAFLLVAGVRVARSRPDALAHGSRRLARLPGCALLLRSAEALALYGGLDGGPDRLASGPAPRPPAPPSVPTGAPT